MALIDGINGQSLYFAAAQSAASQAAKDQTAKKNERAAATKKSSFATAFEQKQAEQELISEGLPLEIAGMSQEEAIIFLKDAIDESGDLLKREQNPANMEKFRKSVSQFMKYIVKNNYEIVKQKRFGRNRKGRPVDPRIQIRIIDEKLNELARGVLYNQQKNLNVLARVEELNGLIVDLIAA